MKPSTAMAGTMAATAIDGRSERMQVHSLAGAGGEAL
jgi:hypothetical protein